MKQQIKTNAQAHMDNLWLEMLHCHADCTKFDGIVGMEHKAEQCRMRFVRVFTDFSSRIAQGLPWPDGTSPNWPPIAPYRMMIRCDPQGMLHKMAHRASAAVAMLNDPDRIGDSIAEFIEVSHQLRAFSGLACVGEIVVRPLREYENG